MAKPVRSTIPVLFRKDDEGTVTAFFPTLPGSSNGGDMTCYTHVGQHSSCSYEWMYRHTKLAQPGEYANLLAEITQIYGTEFIDLKVYKRCQPSFRAENLKEYARCRATAT
jgi:hypothetical protein